MMSAVDSDRNSQLPLYAQVEVELVGKIAGGTCPSLPQPLTELSDFVLGMATPLSRGLRFSSCCR
jgi:hypothetical protein